MRKEYGKALRELFSSAMALNFPEWRAAKAPSTHYWPGERVFVLDDKQECWLIVVLEPDLKDHDVFNLEIGWSRQKRVPELAGRPCVPDIPDDHAVDQEEFLFRLSGLDPSWPGGWVIDERTFSVDPEEIFAALVERQTKIPAEEARLRVAPFVESAIISLNRYGIPYLEKCLQLMKERSSHATTEGDAHSV